jgi:hypothetical protein
MTGILSERPRRHLRSTSTRTACYSPGATRHPISVGSCHSQLHLLPVPRYLQHESHPSPDARLVEGRTQFFITRSLVLSTVPYL